MMLLLPALEIGIYKARRGSTKVTRYLLGVNVVSHVTK